MNPQDFFNNVSSNTIYHLLKNKHATQPDSVALLSPGHHALTFRNLFQLIEQNISDINSAGIGRGDPVAIVLPGGAEMALAFLSVSCAAISAPLNPLYQEAEFEFYLSDLGARALLILENHETRARKVAEALYIPIIELVPQLDDPSTWFRLKYTKQAQAQKPEAPSPEDVALVLHTSGTTSKPKQVPLAHANLCASAKHISAWLDLSQNDRCLNIMPLFHIHGLAAALLASLAAGGGVVCAPNFNAPMFFEWVDTFKPTWYTAVPTMHHAILGRANENLPIIERSPLRFIRSSSSHLPPQLMKELESALHAPVIEAYGMTEASHQMASNPLPPKTRKAGSVGLPAGPEITLMQEDGDLLCKPGELGEIVIQGPNVTTGYLANPQANQKAFTNGWFRTGDQGYFDEDGYLFITGRLKELINRGGEKISPREVEEVLLNHPGVAQAVVFAMPDEQLGEEVAAAVVLRDGSASEQALRQFAAQKLALFKVPRRIIFLDEIPKGATGKVQRIGLADRLGFTAGEGTDKSIPDASPSRPRNQVEEKLHHLWCEVLRIAEVGVNRPFLEVGGDSLLATLLISRVREVFPAEITLLDFFDAKTIEEQAKLIQKNLI